MAHHKITATVKGLVLDEFGDIEHLPISRPTVTITARLHTSDDERSRATALHDAVTDIAEAMGLDWRRFMDLLGGDPWREVYPVADVPEWEGDAE